MRRLDRVTRWLWLALALTVGALGWSLRSGAAADQRARTAEHQVDSLASLRKVAEEKAASDSVALEGVWADALVREDRLEASRAQALGRASVAHEEAGQASESVRSLLDSLGASTALLDRLNAAHAEQVAALGALVAVADSTTAVEVSLREATERALASERVAHQATSREASALQVETKALKAGRRRDRLGTAVVVVAVLGAVVLR